MPSLPILRRLRAGLGAYALVCTLVLAPGASGHDGLHERIARASEAIDAAPSCALLLRRAELFRLHGDLRAALADCERAGALDSEEIEVHLVRGRALRAAGRRAEALDDFDRFLGARPGDARGWIERAGLMAVLGRREAAVADWSRALDLSARPSPDHYLARARLLAGAPGDGRERALASLAEAGLRVGAATALELYAAELEVELGRHDAALARIDGLAERAARREEWLCRRGEILLAAGRPADAGSTFAEAGELLAGRPAGIRNTRASRELWLRIASGRRAAADHDTEES